MQQNKRAMGLRGVKLTRGATLAVCLVALTLTGGCSDEADVALTSVAKAPAAKRTPNLVIITLDTTRADALSAYGQSRKTSPAFDRMAAEGVLFYDAMTSSPETMPSHATIFTGKQPFAHGVRGNGGYVLANEHLTIAEVMKAEGYATRAEIAAVVMQESTQIGQGFSTFRDTSSEGVKLQAVFRERDGELKAEVLLVRDAGDITDSGIEFVRDRRDEKFFLWLHYFNAHAPYSAAEPFSSQFPDSLYHAEVAIQDFEMGRFVDELRNLGLADNTLVIVAADHGEGLLEHGERTHSYFLYDSTMRVPLLFWGLDTLPKGKRIDSLVRNVDIAPTALDLLGLYPLDNTDGVTLGPLLDGTSADLQLVAYGEANRMASTFKMSPLRFVREGRWKYIHKVNPELYDMSADPGELSNLYEAEPEIAARLLAKLETIVAAAPTRKPDSIVPVSQRVASQLRALGYVEVEGKEALSFDGESLKVFGDDPRSKTEDIDLAGWAVGAVAAKKYADALAFAEPFRKRNPHSLLAVGLVAESLAGLERWDEAIPMLRHSIELNPASLVSREKLVTGLVVTKNTVEAIEQLSLLNRDRPCDDSTLGMLNQFLHQHARYEEQRDVLAAAADACPELLTNLNNYAWLLASAPDAELRDGRQAIRVIRQAISDLEEPNIAFLDTLAAAMAEVGRFEDAVKVQTDVIGRLKKAGAPDDALSEFFDHLKSYEAGKPLRDGAV